MMPLHIDYRPRTLDEVIGNDGIKESIYSVFTREDKPHTVLMCGPSGSGKTTIARIIATMLGCDSEDILEYNSANTRGIDTIRNIVENCQYAPLKGKYKVYILDEAHKITNDAQNALLKVLEDTPKHVFFIICTTDPEKLITTVKKRCMTFEVKGLAAPQMTKLLNDTVKSEGIDDFPKSIITEIVKTAEGCPRQALVLLDSVIDIEDEVAALRAISESTATETASIDLCRLLLDTRKGKWADARFLLKGLPDDPEKVRYSILGYMAAVLISDGCKDPDHVSGIIDQFTESFMYSGKGGLYNAVFNACKL
jgi:DNA polymerase III gamma/tau subunit